MNQETIDMKEMLEAGVHFGHKRDRWNPQMAPFIFTERNGVHIFDLAITKNKLEEAMKAVSKFTSKGGTILFVGTKNQVQEVIKNEAESCKMPYLVERWPGGMLTNFQTIVKRLKYLEETEQKTQGEENNLTKKERLSLQRELEKLNNTFEGVKEMRKLPEILFVSDIVKERIAVREAQKAKIPIIGIADSNATPDIEYLIPGNDDAVKSVKFIANKIAKAVERPKTAEIEKDRSNKLNKQKTEEKIKKTEKKIGVKEGKPKIPKEVSNGD